MAETKDDALKKTDDAPGGSGTTDSKNAGAKEPKTEPKPKAEAMFTAAEMEANIEKRLMRDRDKLERAHRAEIKKRDDLDLEAGAEWQKLAESRQSDIGKLQAQLEELKPQGDKLERFEAALTTYVEKLKAGVPEEIMALLEGQDVDAQLEWLTKNAGTFVADDKTNGQPAGGTGIPPTPKPSDSTKLADKERRKRAHRIRNF